VYTAGGHYLAEERPAETLAALREFLTTARESRVRRAPEAG
jgi:hypothetical protein